MKEIGGYFGLDEFTGDEYHSGAIKLNSARNSIVYLMKSKKIKKIYIPFFLCDSVKNVLVREKYSFEEYHIDENLLPIINFKIEDSEYILVINYFGQIEDDTINNLRENYKNIIIDNTQSFFSKKYVNIPSFNSCRKFFGVSDGSYLYTDEIIHGLEQDVSLSRMQHILGRYEQTASEHYKLFIDNDRKIANEPLKKMSNLTNNLLKAVDYEQSLSKRNENFCFLFDKLSQNNKLKLRKIDGAFCYPFYVDNGEQLRKFLISKSIYVPMLWPEVLFKNNVSDLEKDFTLNIVHIPCDQRYDLNDMSKIVSEVKKCLSLGN